MRYLGLDVGGKKIGVAAGEVLAEELTTLEAPKDFDFYSTKGVNWATEELAKLLKQEAADGLVVGLPVDESGQATEESAKISTLCETLGRNLNIKVHFVDETLTSFMAADMLSEQGLSSAEIAKREHQLAAQLILQQFLEGDNDSED